MKREESSSKGQTLGDWVDLYADNLYSWALHKTGDKSSSEDIVQDTFLAAQLSFEKFEGRSSPKTWLFSILNNKIIDFHRNRFKSPAFASLIEKNSIGIEDSFISFFDAKGNWQDDHTQSKWQQVGSHLLDNSDFNKVLSNCLQKLPSKWHSAVHMKYLKEEKGSVICQELNITPSNFWQILHRAKIQMKDCIEQNWFNS